MKKINIKQQKSLKENKNKKIKALVLFSGGLDSRLVAKILKEQSLEVELLYFMFPLGCGCCNSLECSFNFSQKESSKLTIIDCTKGKLFEEYIKMIKNPKHGRGSSMNPCIDCKIFMFKKAGEYAKKHKIRIIATGEVVGERPMSQNVRAMKVIDDNIGCELLRPLSAKLLPETKAEKEKLVNREKFFDINGRSRTIQMELARKYNITYPSPAGGCFLCEKAFGNRIKDILLYEKHITPEKFSTLGLFRHFRSKGKILLGRNHEENLRLQELNKKIKYNVIIPPKTNPGPTCLYEKSSDENLARELQQTYTNKDLKKREALFEKFGV